MTFECGGPGRIAYEREDWSTALFEMRPLALRGEARAQYVLGLTYQFGRGVPQDEAQAFHWYMLAAMQGYRAGQTKVGVMYYVGRGVPQDYKQRLYGCESPPSRMMHGLWERSGAAIF